MIATLPTAELTAKYLNWLSPMNDGVLQAALSAYPESNSILAIAGRRYLASGRLSKADDVATRLVLLEDPVGYKLMGTIFLRKDKPLRAYHMFIAAEDAPSRIRAAEIALKAGLPKRALVAIDKVRAEPQYLKQIQVLRKQALSELQSQTSRPVNAIDVFEQPAKNAPIPPSK